MASTRSLLVLAVVGAMVLGGAPAASASLVVPIPPGPGDPLVPAFVGAPATARPYPGFPVPRHPFMAPNGSSNMHNDAYATDAYETPGPLGRDPRVTSATYGIQECATQTFDAAGRIVALCGGLLDRQLKLIERRTLRVLATYDLPPPRPRPGQSPLTDVCGGAYFYLDDADRAVVATTNGQVRVIAQTSAPGFAEQRRHDLAEHLPADDCLIALNPDWSGRIWFVTGGGGVGTIAPDTGIARVHRLPGERIANSFAVDETGGVFVVSDHALYRFDAGADGAPVVSWRRPYDRGSRVKPGQLSQGSGTTPTLIGADLVAITDNAEPRMNVLVYPRGRADGGRPASCRTPVLPPGSSATENSMVAVGRSVIVENNYGYTGPASTLLGNTTAPGIEKVDIHGDGCSSAWRSEEVAPTSVPKASLASGLLYVYTKPANRVGIAAWYFTAIDLRTGRTVYQRLTGTGVQWNNHYAAIYLGPDNAAYLATIAGMVRIADSE
ncbi:hypothetical protein SAMN05421810_103501 [Amycolatopsis arida]|uniref:PQQ-like domain-containing protein n=1 Tax=Amycolatopsis arida TaxID=587909 RepID=A0A1I5TEZ7_9PSEU|nr:hypothetical protein [Amycolatopsis arida]TDX96121.1 hypothetical protein CLV69_103256 [Amycolatopsis arida]SFP81609.1 hypothetical protein SAMN05421810_103501 [Amycolatopsis arida]